MTDEQETSEQHAEEIMEVLDQAWNKIQEARELIRYAYGLVGSPTEAARWRLTERMLARWQSATILVAAAWDKSPLGREVSK